LFLHGYLSNKQSFAYSTAYFSKFFDVHAIDLKGFGENQPMQNPYSLDDYVLDVKKYIQENNLKSPHVIGHSFGCRIIIKALSTQPDLFDKVVLTGAAGLKPKNTLKKRIKRAAFSTLKVFMKRERLTTFYSPDYLALSPVMKESFKLIINEHLDGVLYKIKNPTLLVFGSEDKDTPLYMARRLNGGIENSTLKIIDGAGHFCFIDKSAKFNMEVREFLLSN
jgi:pimeloyl-ACP methyl ester carboxylesterase